MVKVSVIIPVYNMEKYLGECLDSVFGQTLGEIEVICVDDGSTDTSGQILKDYQNEHTNMIVIRQDNGGSGAARNSGLKIASGEFTAFMDPDDFYPQKDVLERLYATAVRNNVNICGGSAEALKEGKRWKSFSKQRRGLTFDRERLLSYRDYQYQYGYSRFLYRTQMLRESGIEFPLFRRNQDPPFMVRAMLAAGELYVVPDSVYVMRSVDKDIKVYESCIICDIARGFLSVMELSKKYELEKLHMATLEEIHEKWIEQFYIHVYNGDGQLYGILQNINDSISEKLLCQCGNSNISPYFLPKEDIARWAEVYIEKEKSFRKIIVQYKEVIIYGAGKIGKDIYDYIVSIGKKLSIYFAVTDISGKYTARGIEIKNIEEYASLRAEALVIVAASNQYQKDMADNARRIGFLHVLNVEKAPILVTKGICEEE